MCSSFDATSYQKKTFLRETWHAGRFSRKKNVIFDLRIFNLRNVPWKFERNPSKKYFSYAWLKQTGHKTIIKLAATHQVKWAIQKLSRLNGEIRHGNICELLWKWMKVRKNYAVVFQHNESNLADSSSENVNKKHLFFFLTFDGPMYETINFDGFVFSFNLICLTNASLSILRCVKNTITITLEVFVVRRLYRYVYQ